MKKDAYISELERQDIALRERIEHLCREKEKLEASIANQNEMLRGCYEVGIMNFYHITLCFPTEITGSYDKCETRVSNRAELLDFFLEDSTYDRICNGRETPMMTITRPSVRRLPSKFAGFSFGYNQATIKFYDTPKLPGTKYDENIQICLTTSVGKKVLYKSDGGNVRKTMPELIEMMKDYLKNKEGSYVFRY